MCLRMSHAQPLGDGDEKKLRNLIFILENEISMIFTIHLLNMYLLFLCIYYTFSKYTMIFTLTMEAAAFPFSTYQMLAAPCRALRDPGGTGWQWGEAGMWPN